MVHRPGRRHDRLRREPAEEVPGHLPDQLRQRPRRALRRGAADRPALDRRTGSRSSGSTTRTPSRSTFWEWLIAEVKATDPDVLFLAEAFTRPPMMHVLGKVGFTQSYTYFTWRNEQVGARGIPPRAGRRPATTCGPTSSSNTPDILPTALQYGGPGHLQHPGRRWPRRSPRPGGSTPATSCSSTRRCGPAARSTSTRRSSSCGRGTGPPPSARAARWHRT